MIRFFSTIILSLCVSACNAIEITNPPEGYDPFYQKYMDCNGIPVISSEKVNDRAFVRLNLLLTKVLECRPDVRQALVEKGFKYIIIAQEEEVTDIPEYAHMEPKEYWNKRARGFGGRTTSCGEENLLLLPGDRYYSESIFIHELAHGIHLTGFRECEPDFQEKLDKLYKQAMDKGLYKNDYAATNSTEYWAESIQAFFDCDTENNHVHNHVNTRKELIEYDKDMADFITQMMRINDQNDWSYYSLINDHLVETPPSDLNPGGIFKKYIWSAGFSILGTQNANIEEMLLVNHLLKDLYHNRYDILKKMIANKSAIVIYDKNDGYTTGNIDKYIEIESGSLIKNNKPASGNVSNLIYRLALESSEFINNKDFNEKLKIAFSNNSKKWSENSERNIINEKVYFATGVQLYFDAGSILNIDNREKLREFDPELAKLVHDVFKYPGKKKWRLSLNH